MDDRSDLPQRPQRGHGVRAQRPRYSLWSSSPALGVKPMRKCGSRSHEGPKTPSCGVQWTGSISRIG